MKQLCKPGGLIVATTRSYGFGLHGYPQDYWRYEIEDMQEIFSDFNILALEKDPQSPGVFIKARKPNIFMENNLETVRLYSMIEHKRIADISEEKERQFLKAWDRRRFWRAILGRCEGYVLTIGQRVAGLRKRI